MTVPVQQMFSSRLFVPDMDLFPWSLILTVLLDIPQCFRVCMPVVLCRNMFQAVLGHLLTLFSSTTLILELRDLRCIFQTLAKTKKRSEGLHPRVVLEVDPTL